MLNYLSKNISRDVDHSNLYECLPTIRNSYLKRGRMKLFAGLCMLLNCVILCNSARQLDAQLTTSRINDFSSSLNSNPKPTHEEFVFEHEVTRQAAIEALRSLNESFFYGAQCKIVKCTANVMTYCHGPLFINDHCLCEMGHANEGLPFIPHNCYIGEKRHKAWAGSCFCYNQLKECCCAPALAQQWKHISAGPGFTGLPCIVIWVSTALVILEQFLC